MQAQKADPGDDPSAYSELSAAQREALQGWIRQVMLPATKRESRTSYGLKHDFEEDGGFYITNGQFKGAMLAAGYQPVNQGEQNWWFRIKRSCRCQKPNYGRSTYFRCSLHPAASNGNPASAAD